jgi:hypothetical protein
MSDKNRNKVLIIEEATRALKKQKRKNKALRNAFEDLRKQSNLSYYQESLDELKARLTKDYPETRGKNSWQRWIYANNWLFGTHYLEPMQKEKIGFDNIPDYLFPTLDGFLDILEIKRPSFDVVREDTSHVGSYAWCPDTNKAIGQVVNYIQEMERYQSQLTERINEKYGDQYGIFIYPLKPRACILVGTSDSWNPRKKKAFRTLNYSLHGIEVLTFSDLINRGESIISMISRKQ